MLLESSSLDIQAIVRRCGCAVIVEVVMGTEGIVSRRSLLARPGKLARATAPGKEIQATGGLIEPQLRPSMCIIISYHPSIPNESCPGCSHPTPFDLGSFGLQRKRQYRRDAGGSAPSQVRVRLHRPPISVCGSPQLLGSVAELLHASFPTRGHDGVAAPGTYAWLSALPHQPC